MYSNFRFYSRHHIQDFSDATKDARCGGRLGQTKLYQPAVCCCTGRKCWCCHGSKQQQAQLSFLFTPKAFIFFLQYPNTNVYKISIVQRRPQYANIRREMDYTTQAPDDERKKTVMWRTTGPLRPPLFLRGCCCDCPSSKNDKAQRLPRHNPVRPPPTTWVCAFF